MTMRYYDATWRGRACLLVVGALLVFQFSAQAGGLLKSKDGSVVAKSPIVDTVRVSSEGLLPAAPADTAAPAANVPADAAAAQAAQAATPESSAPQQAPKDYTLGPGDTLSFQSIDDPTLSRDQVLVLFDGTISLPLISDVRVEGKTRAEAENLVREAYKAIFKEPLLALNVRAAMSKSFYVFGDVNHPSKFPYEGKTNVLEAVNLAGGLRITQRSGGESYAATAGTLSKAFIIRSNNGNRELIELDLRGLTKQGPHASETPVLPGDVVYIPENVNLVYVLGEVRTPSVFQLAEGQTLLQVLTQAGGFAESGAKMRHVVIIRPVDPTHNDVMIVDLRTTLKNGVDVPMRPGDVVYIPRKDLVRAQEFVSRLTGTISPMLSLYSQFFDTYYAAERSRLLVNTNNGNGNGNSIVNTLQTIRGFVGTDTNNSAALSALSILSAQQQQNQQP